MFQEFTTNRLLLRPLTFSDAKAFLEMHSGTKINRFLRNPIVSLTDSVNYLDKIINEHQKNEIARFAVILKEKNELIGFSGLKLRATEENGYSNFYDLGYRFAEKHWNKGYATEAAQFWITYGLKSLKLPEIHACADNENRASNHLLEKVGFKKINQYIVNNTLHNWYKIKKDEFEPQI
ncbi:GNAT family N-acetyltransferase [Flavobacterium sp. J27]|uniref:GNAT family N-acetyltransferase n=1 Tax=Flavobacterium sp. J27 TaxID=2060419 RepID=UPI00102FD42D|nr:GNAT family N-acetyltransferase [Flavobacterium sp. J27]